MADTPGPIDHPMAPPARAWFESLRDRICAAFEACDFLMDYLKSRAPFWKKETGPDGARWIEPTERDRDDLARWETS
jgi:coproporphyrinogen III oxidase